VIVPANGFATLGLKSNTSLNGNYICNYQYTGYSLGNGADEVVLFNQNHEEVDRVEYDGGPNWPDPNGASMVFTGSSADDNNQFANWIAATLREPTYSGTLTDKGSPGTNGANQNLTTAAFSLQLKVLLQGPFNGSEMSTLLNLAGLLPLEQPFDTHPWYYQGDESVAAIPDGDIVDWIMVELRDAATVEQATENTVVGRQAAFLSHNGWITDLDGSTGLSFEVTIQQQLFVVIRHRNHIGIISAEPLTLNNGVYTFNFTLSQNQAFNGSQQQLSSGVWGMIAADCDASGTIDEEDKSPLWDTEAGISGYFNCDANLDRQVDNIDKNDYWFPNLQTETQIPQ
jgi:hypothetical protein